MHLFYTPDIAADQELYQLSEDESKHCIRVLRLNAGDVVSLIDGQGNLFSGLIDDAHHKRTRIQIIKVERQFGKRNHYLHMAVAPTKNVDRFEWFLEKATEIGVDEITPLICDHSERKEVKIERLEKVITAAVKQSLTAYHPKLNYPKRLDDFLKYDNNSFRYIAHCGDGERMHIQDQFKANQHYTVLIGPEGDFSPREIALASEEHAIPISLGNTRLRTETAALYACFEVNYLNRNM